MVMLPKASLRGSLFCRGPKSINWSHIFLLHSKKVPSVPSSGALTCRVVEVLFWSITKLQVIQPSWETIDWTLQKERGTKKCHNEAIYASFFGLF
jgi:hypothetical protein